MARGGSKAKTAYARYREHDDYWWINECLREGRDIYTSDLASVHEQMLHLVRPLDSDRTLWRVAWLERGQIEAIAQSLRHEEKGWASCAAEREVAMNFIDPGDFNGDWDDELMRQTHAPVLFELRVQVGVMAIHEQIPELVNAHEREVTLAPGSVWTLGERRKIDGIDCFSATVCA
jgi:hypothetical protein